MKCLKCKGKMQKWQSCPSCGWLAEEYWAICTANSACERARNDWENVVEQQKRIKTLGKFYCPNCKTQTTIQTDGVKRWCVDCAMHVDIEEAAKTASQ